MKQYLLVSFFNSLFIYSFAQKIPNAKLNTEYKNSIKKINGKLDSEAYNTLLNTLKKELNIEISDGKSILINYTQPSQNCLMAGLNKADITKVIDNQIRISSEISRNNNTLDFFIYSENALNSELYKMEKIFKLDTGFFLENIFTLHENCSAFFILKPSGEFMKYYGEDYFSQVEIFLKKK